MAGIKHKPFRVACVQLRSGRDVAANIEAASSLIRQACKDGAEFVITPEQTTLMELGSRALFANTFAEDADPGLKAFQALAGELKRWLLIGSLAVRLGPEKLANRSFLLGPDGAIRAYYDKIHMFDVDLPGKESYRESKNYRSGARAVIADLPWGKLGLSICYDLRFPSLYRTLAQSGADFLSVPSAFTAQTGKAHWHVLLRARAIENGCFVFAAAQGGRHENGRTTYGHSVIVTPWGEIIAEAGIEPGIICADIDPGQVAEARARLPSLYHDRPFGFETPIKDLRAS